MDFGSASTEQLRVQIAMLLGDRTMLNFQSDSTFRRLDVDKRGALTLPEVAPLIRKILGISGRVISANEELDLWRRHSDSSMHHITTLQFRDLIQNLFEQVSTGGYPHSRPMTIQPSSVAPTPARQEAPPEFERQRIPAAPTPPLAPPEESWERPKPQPPPVVEPLSTKEGARARSGSRGSLAAATPAAVSKAPGAQPKAGSNRLNNNSNNSSSNTNSNKTISNNNSRASSKAAAGSRGRSSSANAGRSTVGAVTQDVRRSPPPPSAARRANLQATSTPSRPAPDALEEAFMQLSSEAQETVRRARAQSALRPESDFFQGRSTILTSVEAALRRAYKLVQELEGDAMFQDPDFPLDAFSLGQEDPRCSLAPLKIASDQVSWLRPTEMVGSYTSGGSSSSSASCIDGMGVFGPCRGIHTGVFGDGWFATSLGMFLVREDMLFGDEKACREGDKVGLYPRLFWDPALRSRGLYCMRFQKFGQNLYVIIDDRLPTLQSGAQTLFSKAIGTDKSSTLHWVALVEKAYAKLHGGYGALWSGFPDDALRDLTTSPTEKIPLSKYAAASAAAAPGGMGAVSSGGQMGPTGSGPGSKDPNDLWMTVRLQMQSGAFLAACHSKKEDGEDLFIQLDASLVKMNEKVGEHASWNTGLAYNVAYPIVALHEADAGRKFVCLRNVVAGSTSSGGGWLGRWGETDEAWGREIELASTLRSLSVGRGGAFLSDGGDRIGGSDCFWMLFEDWLQVFNHCFCSLPLDREHGWASQDLSGCWTPQSCGGTPIAVKASPPPGTPESWAKNPQCCLVFPPRDGDATASGVDARVEVCLVLQQEDARMEEGSPFPYQDRLVEIFVCILQANPGEVRLSQFNKKRVVRGGVSLMSKRREVFLRTTLTTPGTYLIVPSTWEVSLPNGKTSVPFRLSLHIKCETSRFRIDADPGEGWNRPDAP